MKTYDPSQPLIFVHVPKCAGTSFIRLLKIWFGDHYHHPHVDEQQVGTMLPKLTLRDEQGKWDETIKCIHGHFDNGRGYGLPAHYPEVEQYFTFLRDPFDIVVSMYFFAKAKSASGEFLYDGKQIDIRDRYPNVESYVKDHPNWLYDHLPQDITLENYSEMLPKRFIYIGIFEDMQNSVNQLARVLGKPETRLTWTNRSNYDEPVPETLRDWFDQNHPLLRGIYEFAKSNSQLQPFKSNSRASMLSAPFAVKRLFSTMIGRS